MPSIAPALAKIAAIKEPEEFDPIELLQIAKSEFKRRGFKFSAYDYSLAFGVDYQQIGRWNRGENHPPRLARIRAASLREEWKQSDWRLGQ